MPGAVSGILVAAAVVMVNGCAPAPLPPAGSYSDVVVVADGGEDGEWGPALRALLEREQDYFVASEPLFRVSVLEGERVDETPAVKNVVVCGVSDSTTPVGRRIRDIIGAENTRRVQRGGLYMIRRDDHPVYGQLTLVVTAASATALRAFLRARGDEVSDAIEASCRERLRRNLLRERRDDVAEACARRWGFRLEVPSVYEPVGGPGALDGVELHRPGPPRVLGVFWRDQPAAPAPDAEDDLYRLRAAYVFDRYDGDRMDRSRTRFEPARLDGYTAVRMSGYWFNERHSPAGGFYETYFVWDEKRRRLWAVDLLVYAPGREKTSMLRELRAVAGTFRAL
jgi:hypothetical protein